jgi:tetratricopeptide (TPR) repeat protein
MNVEAALALADTLIFAQTGNHLSDLQSAILRQVWQGQKYWEIADEYKCTEGHAKDVASLLWQLLSKALGEKVTKSNVRSVLGRKLATQSEGMSPSFPATRKSFVGRGSEMRYLCSLVEQGHPAIVIQGEGGIGKTTLAQQYFQQQAFELVLELLMAKETQHLTSVECVIEEWLKKDLDEEPGREFGITLGRLKRHLETRRIGILIDNLEPALDAQGMFIPTQRHYVELLRVLTAAQVQSVTLIASRDRLCEPTLHLYHYRLLGLDLPAWEKYFRTAAVAPNFATLGAMHKTYGGNAKAMGILYGVIQTDYAGDLQRYWQDIQGDPLSEIDLKNLVASQFDRLQSLDSTAYNLLCRLGCYRYQDIPSLERAALSALLSDVEVAQHKRAIQSLHHRSLIEYDRGRYWLHPVIRAEAIARLRSTQQWQSTHTQAAEFWTASVKEILTLQDGIAAWEALYHYLEIQDFERASQVILQPRKNQWGQFLPLGSTLYRMGLLQPVFTAILSIIEQVDNLYHRSELYNILGDLYWIIGNVHQAISCQKETIKIAIKCLKNIPLNIENQRLHYYLKMLEIDSLLSIGLYQLDLWELPKAFFFLNRVIKLAHNTPHARWSQKASVCLALVKSYLGDREEARAIADRIYWDDKLFEETGRFAYFIQILGQTYINLGETEKAVKLLQGAIDDSQKSHYPQVKAKALMSLAEVDRQEDRLDSALTKQLEAIRLLEEIGAKCDLAEAYYQLGLTQQRSGKIYANSFHRATELFTEIEAPKQVDKVHSATR